MKEAIKFTKIDFATSKGQAKLYLFFLAVAGFCYIMMGSVMFLSIYLAFGSVILSTTPFSLENVNNCAFINLLPASPRSRVCGRYMYALSYLLITCIISEVASALTVLTGRSEMDILYFIFPCFMVGMALFFESIQYLLLYILGVGKNSQYMRIVCMLPGFIMFAISSAVSEQFQTMTPSVSTLTGILAGGAVLGIAAFIVAMEISIIVVKKKDSV